MNKETLMFQMGRMRMGFEFLVKLFAKNDRLIINVLLQPEDPADRLILFSPLPKSLAILWSPKVGVFFVVISTRHSPGKIFQIKPQLWPS